MSTAQAFREETVTLTRSQLEAMLRDARSGKPDIVPANDAQPSRKSSVWSEDDKRFASKMWKDGKSVERMAVAFSVTEEAIRNLMRRNRPLFPHRQTHTPRKARQAEPAPAPKPEKEVSAPTVYADRVTRIVMGATVTLPRVTFIDGPYLEAAE